MVASGEPCHGLFEGERDGRWVQAVYVVRGDTIAEWARDFGPATDYADVTPILIPGFGDDSVGALQYLADKNRQDDYWAKRSAEMLASSTLITDHARQAEVDWEVIQNRSVFGPAVSAQRNSYSRSVAVRKLSAARQQSTGIIPQRGRHP